MLCKQGGTISNSCPHPVAPERIGNWGGGTGLVQKWGHQFGAKRWKLFFLVVPLHFLVLKVQLIILVSAFVMVSTVCLFAVLHLTVPLCPAVVKVGGARAPPFPCPMELVPLSTSVSVQLHITNLWSVHGHNSDKCAVQS